MFANYQVPKVIVSSETFASIMTEAGVPSSATSLLQSVSSQTIEIDPRRPFRTEKHPADQLILVAGGLLAKYQSTASGHRQVLGLAFRGDLMLPYEGRRLYGLQPLVKSQLILVPKPEVDRMVEAAPSVRHYFWKSILRDEAINHQRIVGLARRDAAAKVAHLLSEFRLRGSPDVSFNEDQIPITQAQVGEITGQTSINVNRVLGEFESQGWVERRRSVVHVKNWPELEQLSAFDPEYLAPELRDVG